VDLGNKRIAYCSSAQAVRRLRGVESGGVGTRGDTGNRPWNRGLRLDYFVSSSSMVAGGARPALYDAWVMHDAVKSYGDHCPVAVVLSL
jgi:hypothetical protein